MAENSPAMKTVLNQLFDHRTLSAEESHALLIGMGENAYSEAEMAACLGAFRMRSMTVAELEGFRRAMLQLCRRVDLSKYDAIDLCGTGGDGKNTFNISTLSSFVVAACGVPVAKHGNYGVSSVCGSSNVLEAIGVKFQNEQAGLLAQLDAAGICFMHAPLFHPAMKYIAPVRRALGVSTFFNMLGPIVNPSSPRRQMIGVYSLELARLYAYTLQQTDKEYAIVHSLDGYDETSLTGPVRIISRQEDLLLSPSDFGLKAVEASEIHGGNTVEEATEIFLKVLSGKGSDSQNAVVCANSALALRVARPELKLKDAAERARDTLTSGKAQEVLEKLQALAGSK
ncbi:MAG: anthranilate phosphoribosyltransferase [Bdellovibrionales bacterium]|nr:anthranilate phosphoribosyltransferase [Bdellovibrionales bacterium]